MEQIKPGIQQHTQSTNLLLRDQKHKQLGSIISKSYQTQQQGASGCNVLPPL